MQIAILGSYLERGSLGEQTGRSYILPDVKGSLWVKDSEKFPNAAHVSPSLREQCGLDFNVFFSVW